MRIIIDLQGAQAGSRQRGIGRYALAFTKAFIEGSPEHDIIIFLNAAFPDSVDAIRTEIGAILPLENIVVWSPAIPADTQSGNEAWRRKASELSRESFLASLKPDLVIISSLFEGLSDVTTSIGTLSSNIKTAVILYDLIPYIHPDPYLLNPVISEYYYNKIDNLKRADFILAISESSRQESIKYLGFSPDKTVNISASHDSKFKKRTYSRETLEGLKHRFSLTRPFVMYTGGIDHRKNIEGLIKAYAELPETIRNDHQLAIVCSVDAHNKARLLALANEYGLAEDSLILTGYVSDEDLIALYHSCTLFVFPPTHEGFGLPALEAMACGAPVIASNLTSLPEVVGIEEALFDPYDTHAIAEIIVRGLTDQPFRTRLRANAVKRARQFSWAKTAKLAKSALEDFHTSTNFNTYTTHHKRPKMAYISPLPGARTGIANYSAEILPELTRFYDIDVVIQQEEDITDPWVKANVRTINPDSFRRNYKKYNRVIYHFGNSHFHQHMFPLIGECPGICILHDFYLSGIQSYRELHGRENNKWSEEIYHSHGYGALADRFNDSEKAHGLYPTNRSVIQDSLGLIVHSDYSKYLADHWYGNGTSASWRKIPHLRVPPVEHNPAVSRQRLGYKATDFIICSFGFLHQTKQNHRLLEAFLASDVKDNPSAHLVFVGEAIGDYGDSLRARIADSGYAERITISGWTELSDFRHYLSACDCAVQLRTHSRGETSGTILDCLNYGLPLIINANGAAAEFADTVVCKLPDEFSDQELIVALERLVNSSELRTELSVNGTEHIRSQHNPQICAEQYYDAIEAIYKSAESESFGAARAIADLPASNIHAGDLAAAALSIAQTNARATSNKQLFVDVSELVKADNNIGQRRIPHNLLNEILLSPPDGYRIEPVYANQTQQGYIYARDFTCRFLGCPQGILSDEPIDFASGDIFIGLDYQPGTSAFQAPTLQHMRTMGVGVYFVVSGLLPLEFSDQSEGNVESIYGNWLNSLPHHDGLICVSKYDAERTYDWVKAANTNRTQPLRIGHFTLGTKIKGVATSQSKPDENIHLLQTIKTNDTFLMVGTLTPLKGHADILDAFDMLWGKGTNTALVIVGKQGWMVEELVQRIEKHPELNEKLFWLKHASDELLDTLYETSTALIAASYDEASGLMLTEAASHSLPIIARDIPAFREAAGKNAHYFDGKTRDIFKSISNWIKLKHKNNYPISGNIPRTTWEDAALKMLDCILQKKWDYSWTPDNLPRYRITSPYFGSNAGLRTSTIIKTNGTTGYLFYGPYIVLQSGRYNISIVGKVGRNGTAGAFADVTISKGTEVLLKRDISEKAPSPHISSFELTLENDVEDLEVRLWVNDDSDLLAHSIEIEDLNGAK